MDSIVSHYTRHSPPPIYVKSSYPRLVTTESTLTTLDPFGFGSIGPSSLPLSPDSPPMAPEFTWNWSNVLITIILTLITCGTIFGNGLVLLSMKFSRDKNLRSSTHYFIANLAAADFCVGVFVHPFLAALTVSGKWYFGQTYCTTWEYIHFWLCSASILSVCAVCIDRYVGVRFPLKHFRLMNKKKVLMMCCGVWATALFLSATPLTAWPETPSGKEYDCTINQQPGHVWVATVGILYIPSMIMLVLYGLIYRITVKHFRVLRDGLDEAKAKEKAKLPKGERGRASHIHPKYGKGRDSVTVITSSGGDEDYSSHSTGSTSGGGASGGGTSTSSDSHSGGSNGELIPNGTHEQQPEGNKSSFQSYINGNAKRYDQEQDKFVQNRNRQLRVAKRLALVVFAFLFSYVPFFTVFLINALHPGSISGPVFFAFGWIRYFNSCLNPIIYAATLPAFKKSFKEILCCKFLSR